MIKYGSDTDGWSYCSIENNNCYLGYHTYQIRYGYSGNYVIKDFAYMGNKNIPCNKNTFPEFIENHNPSNSYSLSKTCYKRAYLAYKNKGTYSNPFRSIKKAIENSNSNTTIFLLRGQYSGSMNCNIELGYNLTLPWFV